MSKTREMSVKEMEQYLMDFVQDLDGDDLAELYNWCFGSLNATYNEDKESFIISIK